MKKKKNSGCLSPILGTFILLYIVSGCFGGGEADRNQDKGYDNNNLYFDDEELDVFKGKKQEDYTDAEIEEFRQILYTMKSEEIDTWVHCLQTRGIEIPQVVKDEILLILQ